MKEIIVEFEKIGHNGIGIGKFNNKVVFAYGVFPQEIAKILVFKEKKNFIEGEVKEIIKPSPYRINPIEDHYLSCSPWQVIDYSYQQKLKKEILSNIFKDFAHEEIVFSEDNFKSPQIIWGYRTKIEYSFTKENGKIYFAFYKRGSYKEKLKLLNGCKLIDDEINKRALEVLDFINNQKIDSLKSFIIRRSINFDDLHFCLLVTEKKNYQFPEFKNLSGFALGYSSPKSPASKIDELLLTQGREYLREKILNFTFLYPYDAFFQNNLEMFEEALKLMKKELNDDFKKVVDLYCGVGIIGLIFASQAKEVIGVEINKNAVSYAKVNADLNGFKNFKAINLPSEKIPLSILEDTDLLILDPPRPGLHKDLIKLILKAKPKWLIYLSCNPITQARDYFLLKESYKIVNITGFDFYPQTPHIESLLILKVK